MTIVFLVPILKASDKREDAFYERLFLEICGQQQAGCVVASLFATFPPICHFWQKWEKWRNRKYTFHLEKGSERITASDQFLQQYGENQSFRILLADLEKEERSKIGTGDKVFCLCSVIFLQLLVTVAIRVACLDFDDKQQLIRLLVYIQSDIIVKFVHTVPCLRKLQSKYLLISAFCCSDFVHFVALRLPHHLLLDSPLSPKKNITNCSPSEDYNTL